MKRLGIAALTGLLACSPASEGGASDAGGDAPSAEPFAAPLGTDVLLADVSYDAQGLPSIGPPTNLTRRPDYDNQPFFTSDGSGLWYTVNDPHQGQADIWRYDLATGSVSRVTMSSPESEYSATALPDGSGISAVRVEADSTQRLWRFDADGTDADVLMPDVAPVGYHAWGDPSTVVVFVLGDPPTLQRADLSTGRTDVIASGIGRSIQSVPGSTDVSYVQRHEDGTSTIMRLPGDGGAPVPIADAVTGGEDHAWTPDGVLLMANERVEDGVVRGGPVVYAWRESEGWLPIADFSDLHIVITRLAVSPDGTQIALVAEIDPIELPSD